jgi:hypothetical protein
MQVVQIQARDLRWQFHRSANGNWIATCEAIGQAAQAETFDQLPARINEILNHLLLDLYQEGDLDEFLLKHGWQMAVNLPREVQQGIVFEVPYELMAARNAEARARH